jgi:EmrB/QacA subfamily drug resistance transporter
VLAVLCAAVGLVVAAITSLYTAGPDLARGIGASQTQLTWITDAYTLVMAGLLLPCGALGDRIGRRRTLIAGLIVFVLASIVIQFVQTPAALIATRAVLGVGAALILPSTLSLITSTFPADFRDTAVGIWTASFTMAGVIGGLLAAILLEFFSWHCAFWSILAGAVIILAASLTLPTSQEEHPPPLDPAGSLAIMISIGAFVYGFIEAGLGGWSSPRIIVAFAVGLVAAASFVAVQLRTREPLLDVRLFRIRPFAISAFTVTVSFAAIYGMFFLIMEYQQFEFGRSALGAVLPVAAMGITVIPLALASPWLTRRFGLRAIISTGCLLQAAGFLVLSHAGIHASTLVIYGTTMTLGTGLGLNMAPCTTAIINNVSEEKQGVAASVNHATREIGTALGVALFGGLISATYSAHVAAASRHLPAAARSASRQSIAGALQGAARAGRHGAPLAHAARVAFVDATHHTSLVMAGVLAVAGVLAYAWAPAPTRPATALAAIPAWLKRALT